MKIVHYEYRLKPCKSPGEMDIEVIAKNIRQYRDAIEVSSMGEVIRTKPVRTGINTKNISSRYFFGTNVREIRKQQMLPDGDCSAGNFEQSTKYPKISWRTSLKK